MINFFGNLPIMIVALCIINASTVFAHQLEETAYDNDATLDSWFQGI